MATYDEIMAGSPAEAPSLAGMYENIAQKPLTLLEQKKQRLGLEPPKPADPPGMSQLEAMRSLNAPGEDSGLLNLAGASTLRAGGNLADAGRGISNALLGTQFDDREESGWSNQTNADNAAGVSDEYRKQLQADQGQVLTDVANKDWWGATKSSLNVGLRTAADSAGTIPEMLLGAGLTAATGVGGAAILGNKARKVAKTLDKVKDRYDAAKEATLATKALDVAKRVATDVGQASFITADMVQQQRNAYKEANNGEEPSAQRIFGNIALTMVTTAWQPEIAKKLYLPGFKNSNKNAKFIDKFKEEVKQVVANSDQSMMVNLRNRIVSGTGQIFAAGGAEAVQEYAQSWSEILGVNMKPGESGGLLKAAYEQFNSTENQNEAITAAFLGGAAGGATKYVTSAPGIAVGAARDTAIGTGKAISEKARIAAEKERTRYMSTAEEEDNIKNKRRKVAMAKEAVAKNEKIIESLSSDATSMDKITNAEMKERMVNMAKGKDLSDPDVFKAAKDAVIRSIKEDNVNATVAANKELAVVHALVAARKLKSRAKAAVVDVADTKAAGIVVKDTTIDTVKNFKSSTALATAQAMVHYSNDKSKKSANKLTKLASELEVKTLRKLEKIAEDEGLDTSFDILKKVADRKEADLESSGLKRNEIVNFEKLDMGIKKAAQDGKINESEGASFADLLHNAAFSKIADADTAKAISAALDVYENSDYHKNNVNNEESGTLTPSQIAKMRKVLDPQKISKLAKAANKVKDTAVKVKDKVSPTVDKVKEAAEDLVEDPNATEEERAAKAKAREAAKAKKQKEAGKAADTRTVLKKADDWLKAKIAKIEDANKTDVKEYDIGVSVKEMALNPETIKELGNKLDNNVEAVMAAFKAALNPEAFEGAKETLFAAVSKELNPENKPTAAAKSITISEDGKKITVVNPGKGGLSLIEKLIDSVNICPK